MDHSAGMATSTTASQPVLTLDAAVIGTGVAGLYQLHLLREQGLDVKAFDADLASGKFRTAVDEDTKQGFAAGVITVCSHPGNRIRRGSGGENAGRRPRERRATRPRTRGTAP